MTDEQNAKRRKRYAEDPVYSNYYKQKASRWNKANPEKARASVDRYIKKQHENINSSGH